MPLPLPTPELLQGSWTGVYTALTLLTSAIIPPKVTNPVPKAGCDYTPSAAILTILFDKGSHSGKILLNFSGTVAITRAFSGTYEVTTDVPLGIVEGAIRLQFPTTDTFNPGQVSILHFVMRSHEDMVFILEEGVAATSTGPAKTAGGGVIHGTLKKVLPVVAVEPEGGARA
jgi:hypothetical protein